MNNILDALLKVEKAVLDEPCPNCKNKTLEKHSSLFYGPYGGAVVCATDGCNHRENGYSHIARNLISVEPMPEGYKEDDERSK